MQNESESAGVSTISKSTGSVQGTKNNNLKANIRSDVRTKLLEIAGQKDNRTTSSRFLKNNKL
jgi:hypothetical protein